VVISYIFPVLVFCNKKNLVNPGVEKFFRRIFSDRIYFLPQECADVDGDELVRIVVVDDNDIVTDD
jgi:hypothetical protein